MATAHEQKLRTIQEMINAGRRSKRVQDAMKKRREVEQEEIEEG